MCRPSHRRCKGRVFHRINCGAIFSGSVDVGQTTALKVVLESPLGVSIMADLIYKVSREYYTGVTVMTYMLFKVSPSRRLS